MTLLGFLILFVSISVLVADPLLEKLSLNWKVPVDLISDSRKWILYFGIVLGVVMMFNPFVHNSAGERTYVQDPFFGTEKIIFDPGYHWGGFFCRTQEWPDVMSTVFDEAHPVSIRFNDATQASAQANVRWELPKDEVSMINLHKSYRSPEMLQERTLVPYAKECLAFSSQLMESETHYSGGQSKLKEDFRDQLLNGQYVLETNTSFVFDSIANDRIKITNTDIRKDVNGVAIRIPSDVQTYRVEAAFAAVPHVDYEPIVDEKLQAKIEQSTKESIAKQSLITAEQEALTAEAEGRKLIAQTKAKYQAEKEKAVIEAQKAKEVAKEQALQAKFTADKIEQEGRAKAAANKALVDAGLTPLEKATIEKDMAIGVAQALAGPNGITLPSTFIGGGGKNGEAVDPFTAVGLESLINLTTKMSKPKK